jgi:hypothetical protein
MIEKRRYWKMKAQALVHFSEERVLEEAMDLSEDRTRDGGGGGGDYDDDEEEEEERTTLEVI